MAEFASKGVAGAGLGLGIAGTALGLLNNNGGGLGGLLGGGSGNEIARLQAENAMLKSENYADKVGKEVYQQSLADNKSTRDELYAFIKPLAEEAADNRVNTARMEEQIKCLNQKMELREQIVLGKVNEVALTANNGLTALNGALACLQNTVAGITQTIVPASAVCPNPMPANNAWVAPTNSTGTCCTCANS